MPSLNVRCFIEKCLTSVRQQTLQEIEIICVDAGSSDGTVELLQKVANEDKRIRIVRSEKKSYGYQVNLGIKVAQGEYIGIVETDDYIRPEMIERLYDIAAEQRLDYVKADFSMFIERCGRIITRDYVQSMTKLGIDYLVIDTRNYPQLIGMDGYIWKGIYRKSFLRNNDIWLNESTGAAYQDNGFLHQTILYGRRVMYIPESLYQYRRDNENSSDYNPRACRRMADEYEFIEGIRKASSELFDPFINEYYANMYRLCMAQMNNAACYEDVEVAVEKYRHWLKEAYESRSFRSGSFSLEEHGLLLFLDNPRIVWENRHWSDGVRDAVFLELLEAMDKKIEFGFVIVSCGDRGSSMYMLLARNLDTENIWICDNDTSKQGKIYGYHPICSVEQAVRSHPKAVFIIANEKYHRELYKQLLSSGVVEEQIIIINLPIWIDMASSWSRRKRECAVE